MTTGPRWRFSPISLGPSGTRKSDRRRWRCGPTLSFWRWFARRARPVSHSFDETSSGLLLGSSTHNHVSRHDRALRGMPPSGTEAGPTGVVEVGWTAPVDRFRRHAETAGGR